jgi:hypothetical protein
VPVVSLSSRLAVVKSCFSFVLTVRRKCFYSVIGGDKQRLVPRDPLFHLQ